MKLVYLAAGAGGMVCGSCLRDNRLAATLIAQGRDVTLVPLYTPLRTDEPGAAIDRVYYGGINVYLQQSSALFRILPRWMDRLLDARFLLNAVGRLAGRTQAESLGELTVSILRGEDGRQRKELDRLIDGLRDLKPDVVNLANLLFVGLARRIKRDLGVPVVCTLSGEDIFVDRLPESHRRQAHDLIADRARDVDGFIATTRYFAEHARQHFDLPPDRIHYAPLGIRVDDFAEAEPPHRPFVIGYLARICPEKGLAELCEAFAVLRRAGRDCRLRVGGYCGAADKPYLDRVRAFVRDNDLADRVEFAGELSREGKTEFLRGCHVLSVPSVYHEAKGLYIIEALAAGVPVVQPRVGSFPELVQATGGGLLYDPTGPEALADALATLMDDDERRTALAKQGRAAVRASFTDTAMATATWSIYEELLAGRRKA